MYLPPDRVRALLEAHPRMGPPDRDGVGEEVDYWCPFCVPRGKAQSHLHVNYRKNVARCHSCGSWTDLVIMLRALYGEIPRSALEARLADGLVDGLRQMMKVHGHSQQRPVAGEGEAPLVELPEAFEAFDPSVAPTGIGPAIWSYLTGSGEGERGLPPDFLYEVGAGWCGSGRYQGYAVFPVWVDGVLATWTSRRVLALGPKVQHCPASASRAVLFNYDPVRLQGARRVFVGEGPFDGWAFHRRADPNDGGVAVLGKVLHAEQCRLLDALPACEELVVCLDDTEHEATMGYAGALSRMTGKRVSYILLPQGSGDPHKNRRRLPALVEQRVRHGSVMTELRRRLGP